MAPYHAPHFNKGKQMRKIFCLAVLVLAFLLPGQSHARHIENIDNAQLTKLIQANTGKVVVLNFFATWCPPCKMEMPELARLRTVFPPDKLEIIGLSVDEDMGPVPDFLDNAGVNYPVYMAAKDITSAYGIHSVPHNTLFAPDGQMVISEPGLADLDILSQFVSRLLTNSATAK